jgi:cysteinyl-tRNA synthetase
MIRLYNTLTRKKEPIPLAKKLRLFVCGPTVYDYIHIGNARTFTVFDILVRYLRHEKQKVFYLQNITDIDDKIIARAAREGLPWRAVARKFEGIFKKNMRGLGNTSVDKYARATAFIPEITSQVERLIEKGNAYLIDGDGWYFDLSTFPDYGKLARRTVAQAEDGVTRVDESARKRNKGDFCLWKFSKSGEPTWKSKLLGDGRPGWHIEDTAITEHFFGPQYEMHGAGIDLMFPHHEAEIAQQEAASGKKPFVELWMHVGFLQVGGDKMSKSLGNFVTIEKFLEQHGANAFRWLVALHQYRDPMEAGEQVIKSAEKNLADFGLFSGKLDFAAAHAAGKDTFDGKKYRDDFLLAMDDDLNTPRAVAVLFSMMEAINKNLWRIKKIDLAAAKKLLVELIGIFGIRVAGAKIPQKIWRIAARRELSRTNKQFGQSDALRKEIDALGYVMEDTPVGPFIWPKT